MTEHRQSLRIHLRASGNPVERVFQILRESWQRREPVRIAASVIAGVEEQHREAGTMQRHGEGQHLLGIAAPAVKNDYGRSRFRVLVGWDQPGEQLFALARLDASLSVGKIAIGGRALFWDARCPIGALNEDGGEGDSCRQEGTEDE